MKIIVAPVWRTDGKLCSGCRKIWLGLEQRRKEKNLKRVSEVQQAGPLTRFYVARARMGEGGSSLTQKFLASASGDGGDIL